MFETILETISNPKFMLVVAAVVACIIYPFAMHWIVDSQTWNSVSAVQKIKKKQKKINLRLRVADAHVRH